MQSFCACYDPACGSFKVHSRPRLVLVFCLHRQLLGSSSLLNKPNDAANHCSRTVKPSSGPRALGPCYCAVSSPVEGLQPLAWSCGCIHPPCYFFFQSFLSLLRSLLICFSKRLSSTISARTSQASLNSKFRKAAMRLKLATRSFCSTQKFLIPPVTQLFA